MIAVIPLNDIFHGRRFLTVINCFWFPYLIGIVGGNGCFGHLVFPDQVKIQMNFNVCSSPLTLPKMHFASMRELCEWLSIDKCGDTLQYGTRCHTIYSSLSSSAAAINLHRRQYFYTFFIQSSLVPAGVNVNKKRLNVRNRGRECRDSHTMSLRQSSLHIVCTNATE